MNVMAPEISYSVQPPASMTALARQTSLLDDLRSKHGKQANDGSSSTINGSSSQHTGTTSNTTLSGSRSSLLPAVGNGLSKTVGSALNAAAVSSKRLMQFNTTSFTQNTTSVDRATQVQSAPATPTGSSKVVSNAHIRKLLTHSSLLPNMSGHGSVGSNSTGLNSMGSHHQQKTVHPASNSRMISGKISEQAEKVNESIHTMIASLPKPNLPQFTPPTSMIPRVFSSSSFPTNASHPPIDLEAETTYNEGDDDTTATDMDESSRKSHKKLDELVRTDTDESLLKTPSPKKGRVRRREQRQKSPHPRRTSHSPMPSRSRPLNLKSPSNNKGSTNRREEKLGKISPPFADNEQGCEDDKVCESPIIVRRKKLLDTANDKIQDNVPAGNDIQKARRPHKSKHSSSTVQDVRQRQQQRHEKKKNKVKRASKKQKEPSRISTTADASSKSLLDEEPLAPEPSESNPYTTTGAYDIEEDEIPSPPSAEKSDTSIGTEGFESAVKQKKLARASSAPVKLAPLPQQVVKYDDDDVSLDWRDFARTPEGTTDPPPKPSAPTEPAKTEMAPDNKKKEKQGDDLVARGKIATEDAPVFTQKPRRMTQEVLSVRRASRRGRSKSARDVDNIDTHSNDKLSTRRGHSQRELSRSRRSKSPSTFRRCKSQTIIQARENRPMEQRSVSTSRRDMDQSATSHQADKSHRRRKSRERVSARTTDNINPDREKRKSSHERRHRQRSSSLASRQRRKSKIDGMGNSSERNHRDTRYISRRRGRHREGDKKLTEGEDLDRLDKLANAENEPNNLRPSALKAKSCNGIDLRGDNRPKGDSEAEHSALESSGEHGGYGWGILSALGHQSSTIDHSPRKNEDGIASHHESDGRHPEHQHASRTRRESRTRRSSETRRASLLDDRSERSHRRRSASRRRKNQAGSSARLMQDKSTTSVRSLQVDTLVKDRSNRRMGDSSRRKSERLEHAPSKSRLNEAMEGSEKSHSRVNRSRKAMDSSEQSQSRASKSRLAVDPIDRIEKAHKSRSSRRADATDRSEKSHKSRSSRRVAEAMDSSEKSQSRVRRPSLLGADGQDNSRITNEYSGDQKRPLRRPSNEGIIL